MILDYRFQIDDFRFYCIVFGMFFVIFIEKNCLMKTTGLFVLATFFTLALVARNQSRIAPLNIAADSVEIEKADSTEYELIIFDNDFENWFITSQKPKWYHENSYYRSKINFYATDWNLRVLQNMHREPYEYEINVDPNVDYGIDINWKLFWYFKYLEETLGIKLAGGG